MNRFFRVIWSRAHNALIVVPEVGPASAGQPRKRGQKTRKALQTLRVMAVLAGAAIVVAPAVSAQTAPATLPQNGQVAAGQASISTQAPGAMVIDQTSDRAVINWDSFDIGRDASVTFRQPGRNSTALNRVTSTAPSQVLGQLNANGQVFVTNRNGVYFGRGARVNVGGLVATTHDVADDDFMAGEYRLRRDGATGAVINEGELTAADGGYIALLAPEVRNRGVITARLGTVALAAGEAYELSIDENGSLAGLRVEPAQIETLVENGHLIKAPGGKVIMSAGAARELRAGVIRNTGTIEARGIQRSGGRVFLGGGRVQTTRRSRIVASVAPLETAKRPRLRPSEATVHIDAETVSLAGEIDASGTIGGTIAVEGMQIDVAASARFAATGLLGGGDVLIGGDWQGGATDARVFTEAGAMRQAERLSFAAGALVDASAIKKGDGGTIALWSSLNGGTTLAHGTLRSEGGAEGGDGGRIETSGFSLDVAGINVSTDALQGAAGNWLLDPGNIWISDSGTAPLPGSGGPAGNAIISPDTITTALNSSNVTIQTGAGSDYAIYFQSDITYTGQQERTLTFGSDGAIYATSDITSVNAPLNVVMASEVDRTTGFSGSGRGIAMRDSTLTTNGGDVWIGGGELTGSWQGHTVGVGAAMGGAANLIGIELQNYTIDSGGGDVRLVGTSSSNSGIAAYVTASTIYAGAGNVDLISDELDFSYSPGIDLTVNTTGQVTMAPFADSWESNLVWNSPDLGGQLINSGGSLEGLRFSDTLSGLHLGSDTNTRSITIASDLSVAGPISMRGGQIAIQGNLTSSADGDIDLIGSANVNDSVSVGASGSIAKTAGNGTLTMRGGAAVSNQGAITASGTGRLNVVMWSDYDNTADGGGVSILAPITTNGGHVWVGGSSSAQGSYTWNGLTVGDGASVGGLGYNQDALDLDSSINTGGGDVLLWAGDGHGIGVDGIGVSGGANANVTTGAGDITIIANEVLGSDEMMLDNTGTTTLAPPAGAFSAPLAFGWAYDGPDGAFTAANYNAIRFKGATVGGLTIGSYDGMLNGGTPVELSNTADVSLVSGSFFRGDVSFTGGTVDIGRSLLYTGNLSLTANVSDVLIGNAIQNRASLPSSATISAVRHVHLESSGSLTAQRATDMQLRADSDADGDGIVFVEGTTIDTHGGDLSFGAPGATAMIGGQSVRVGGDVFFQRGSAQTLSTRGGALDLYGETIVGNAAGLTINTGNGDARFYGQVDAGNNYTYVDKTAEAGTGSWHDARTEARNGTAGGSAIGDSYLVNITSRLENSIVGLTAGYVGAWIGAWRADPAGSYNWSYADGPEAGEHFFTQLATDGGTAEPGYYENFYNLEPNGNLSAIHEYVGQLYGSDGFWNDLSPTRNYSTTMDQPYRVLGFVRETNLAASPLTINAGTGSLTVEGGLGDVKPFSSIDITASNTIVNGPAVAAEGAVNISGPLSVDAGSLDATLRASAMSVGGDVDVSGATIMQDAPLTAAGAVTLEGTGQVAVNGALTSNGNVTLKAGDGVTVRDDVTTNGGHLVLWADSDENGGDETAIRVENSAISTDGGGVWMGGSYDSNGTGTSWAAGNGDTLTVGDGYAFNGANTTEAAGIFLENGSIDTSGGNIALYGYSIGNAAATQGYGLNIHGQSFDTGGGDLTFDGVFNQTSSTVETAVGLHLIAANGNASSISTGAGDMSLTGITGAASTYRFGAGMYLGTDITRTEATSGGLTLAATTGDITLHGVAERAAGSAFAHGIAVVSHTNSGIPNDVSVTTTTGDISFTGEVEEDNIGVEEVGVVFANYAGSDAAQNVSTDGGAITIAGENGPHNRPAVDFRVLNTDGGIVIGDSDTGDITFIGDRVASSSSYRTALDTAGTLTIEPLNTSFEVSPDLSRFSFESRLGGFTLGKPGNTAAYTSAQALDIGGDVRLYTGTATLGHGITADGTVTVETTTGGILTTAAIDANSNVFLISGDADISLGGSVTSEGNVVAVKAAGSIYQRSGADVVTSGGDITYWSDSDGSGEGAIQLVGTSPTGSYSADIEVRSQGGDIVMGGGAVSAGGKPAGAAASTGSWRQGVRMVQTLIDASVDGGTEAATSGDVRIMGSSSRTGGSGIDLARGVLAMNTRVYGNEVAIDGEHSTADASARGLDANNYAQINAHGAVTLAGTSAVGGNALRVDANAALSSADGDITFDSAGDLENHSTTPIAINTGRSLTVNMDTPGSSGDWATALTGAGEFSKTGPGTLSFGGTHSYTGDTQVSAGTLELDTDLSNSAVTVASGATLSVDAARQVGALAGAGAVAMPGGGLTIGALNSDTTFSGVVSGSGGLTKTGTGTLTLSGANTYGGTTTVAGGTLAVTNADGLGSTAAGTSVANGAVLEIAGGIAVGDDVTLAGGAELAFGAGDNRLEGDVTATGSATISTTSGNQIVAGTLSAAGQTVTLESADSLQLAGQVTADALSFGGPGSHYVNANFNAVGSVSSFETTGNVTMINDGDLTVGAAGIETVNNIYLITQNGDLTVEGDLHAGGAELSLVAGVSVAPGTLTGGDVIVVGSPSISVGAGGRAIAYTGSVARSAGLTDLVGAGSGRFRYDSSYLFRNYNTPLPRDVLSAVYRESIALTGAIADQTITYGDAAPVVGQLSGIVNGDDLQLSVVGPMSSAGALTAGSYTTSAAVLNSIGYDVSAVTDGTLTVSPKAIDASGVSASNKTYDGTDTATLTGTLALSAGGATASDGAYLTGDTVALSGTPTASFSDAQAGTGKAVTVSGVTLSGADAGNYVLSLPNLSADIGRRVVGLSAAKVYDSSADLSGDVTVTTGVSGETLSYSGAAALGEDVSTANNFITALTLENGSGLASNYVLPTLNSANAPVSITPRALTLSYGSPTRVYDGTTMVSLNRTDDAISGDDLTISESAAFDTKHVGTGKTVNITGITLGGADAGNYSLASNSATLTNGEITRRALTLSYAADSKVYDGNTSATITRSDDRVSGDSLTITETAAFDTKNAGTGRTVTISGISLGGADAGNYSTPATSSTSADITRLASVTWIGGPSGDWHDPANWLGGAVPDLSNVAQVVIPNGVQVVFGSPVVSPAEAGPVNVDGIGSGGTLAMQGGTLNVGVDGIVLEAIDQTGGTLTSLGDIVLDDLGQTGGDLIAGANLRVAESFEQRGLGSIVVSGGAALTDTNGGTQIGDLAVTGHLNVSSADGPITQNSGSTVAVGGTTTLFAETGGAPADITLAETGNNFGGAVIASGDDITLVDASGLTLGDISASGDLIATAAGDLTVAGNIQADAFHLQSTGGSMRQAGGSLQVSNGPSSITAHDQIMLFRNGNAITGDLTLVARRVVLRGGDEATNSAMRSLHGGIATAALPSRANQPTPIATSAVSSGSSTLDQSTAGIRVSVTRLPTATTAASILVTVPSEIIRTGQVFNFRLPVDIRALAGQGTRARAEMMNGDPLPDWLSFDAESLTFFVENAEAGALPLNVRIAIGAVSAEMQIDER